LLSFEFVTKPNEYEKRLITELTLLFGGSEPTLPHFSEKARHLTVQERSEWMGKIFCIALSNWNRANVAYRNFLVNWIVAHRQEFIDYYRRETVMGCLAVPAGGEPELLVLFFKLWYEYALPEKVPMRGLLFQLALSFDQPYSLKTLCNRAAAGKIDAGELLDILGWTRLG